MPVTELGQAADKAFSWRGRVYRPRRPRSTWAPRGVDVWGGRRGRQHTLCVQTSLAGHLVSASAPPGT